MGDFKTVRQISYANKTPYNFFANARVLIDPAIILDL